MISKRREHQSFQDIGLILNNCVSIGEGNVISTSEVWSLLPTYVCKGNTTKQNCL